MISKTRLGVRQSSYSGLSWEQGVGGLPGLREGSLHMTVCLATLPPATPLCFLTHSVLMKWLQALTVHRNNTENPGKLKLAELVFQDSANK